MSDFPDPDEEFELMYGDELEVMRELEEQQDYEVSREVSKNVRRSLKFANKENTTSSNSILEETPKSVLNKSFHASDCIPLPASQNIEIIDVDTVTDKTPITNDTPITDKTPDLQEKTNENHKRTFEEIFGDIADLNFEDSQSPSKRFRPEGEEGDPDLILIEKILNARKLRNEVLAPSSVGTRLDSVKGSYDKASNVSFNIPRWPFIPLTKEDGDRIYIRFHSEEYMDKDIHDVANNNERLREMLEDTYKNTWVEARTILNMKLERENAHKNQPSAESQLSKDLQVLEETVGVEGSGNELWVDKYKPTCYVELLSDEATNRTILHWLKLWDKVVFNREIKLKAPQLANSFNKRSGKFEFGNKYRKSQQPDVVEELDDHGRPFHKMALLCGPPGCGKTTLAHLIAKQAGYRPVELNASDDRSVEAFKTALENATFMKSVLDTEKRPNCLILDEIDGAPLPAIEYLIKFCSGAALTKAKKGQKTKAHILKRPIICICNDPYAPALRPLRQVAFVVHFPPPLSSRLATRLSDIAFKQGLQADVTALTALSEKTSNDIRACLGVLYFFKAKGKEVRLSDVMRINVGKKDMTKGVYQVLQEIFHVKLPPHRRMGEVESDIASNEANKKRFFEILNTVISAGDTDRLLQGVFENYLEMRQRDSLLRSVISALNWFTLYDELNSKINTTQNYSMMPYLPYAIVNCHFLFATIARQKIKFPKEASEIYQKQQITRSILEMLIRGLSPKLRPFCSRWSLTLDILPLLPYIITPHLKSANIQLYTEKERQSLQTTVAVMADFNINYVQERTPDGTYTYSLEPDILHIGLFDSKLDRVLPYAMKQVISREVEIEKIHRAELKITGPEKPLKQQREIQQIQQHKDEEILNSQLPNHLQRLEPKMIDVKRSVIHKDFFGRTITASQVAEMKAPKDGKRDIIAESKVFFHYQEGYNNAVRRNVKMQDLL